MAETRFKKFGRMRAKTWPLRAIDLWVPLAVVVLALGLYGCAGSDIPDAKAATGRKPLVAEVPDASETVRGDDDPAIVTLDIGEALHEKKLTSTDDLPGNIIIPTTNLKAVPVTAALEAVLAGTDVSLSWDSSSFDKYLVTVMNLSGPLPRVVEKICASAKVFCQYRQGALELRQKETFIVALPPVAKASNASSTSISSGSGSGSGSAPSTFSGASAVPSVATAAGNTMADTIGELAGEKVSVDDQGGNIIYTTDFEGQDRVRQYLQQLRNGRPLVVLQMHVWNVQLKKENAEGINWNSIKLKKIGGEYENILLSAPASTVTSVGTGGVSLGAVTAGKISADLIAKFLSTQGRLQTISSPQITFVSGASAQFTAGGVTNYISQVGQVTTVSGTPNSTSNNTISTSSIVTGLSVSVSGAYENGVVFANLNLALTTLLDLNPTNSGGATINLPTTTNQNVSTIIRVRPGDSLVMAGLVSSSDANSRSGVPLPLGGRLPMYGDESFENDELVIMVKPSVVLFSDKKLVEENKKKEEAKPLPAAMVIDSDGATPLALPNAPGEQAAAAPVPASAPAAPVENEENAPVNQAILQRGFSHAFDELLQPAATTTHRADTSAGGGVP